MYAGVETSIMILWEKGLASGLEFGLASLLLIHSTDIILIDHDSVHKNSGMQPVRLAGGWWLVLVCSERTVLLSGCWWLICSERKVPLAGG
jgi:hypothetical protein